MKIKQPWHSGFGPNWWIFLIVIICDAVVVFMHHPIYTIGITTIPIIVSVDHALWNISPDERKYSDTGFGCGFRIWLK